MNQYLYTLKPARLEMLIKSTPAEDEIVGRHFNRLKALTEQGVVILAGRTTNEDESTFGIVIFEAETDRLAQELMENDPAVKEGVMTAKLFPYRVALIRKELI